MRGDVISVTIVRKHSRDRVREHFFWKICIFRVIVYGLREAARVVNRPPV
jgi:hypothetical protein